MKRRLSPEPFQKVGDKNMLTRVMGFVNKGRGIRQGNRGKGEKGKKAKAGKAGKVEK
jgi:hypothetical protein